MSEHKGKKFKTMDIIDLFKAAFAGTTLLFIMLSMAEGCAMAYILRITISCDRILPITLLCIVSSVIITLLTLIVFGAIIKKISDNFTEIVQAISSGNLSMNLDRKEYKALGKIADHINSITLEMRKIIQGTYELTRSIVSSSLEMSDKVKQARTSITEISNTIDEIAAGASVQVSETQKSVAKMEELSEHIATVSSRYYGIIQETKSVSSLNKEGINIVKSLSEKAVNNRNSSEEISAAVENLIATLKNIELFVDSIQDIASQTSLLALNAAIEAARAGESGRGFAVVAEEVKKLAEQSKKSTEDIKNMMNDIQKDSQQAISAVQSMYSNSKEQLLSVEQTESSFKRIAQSIESIISKIDDTNNAINQMESLKNETISTIEETAKVSEQAAAASEELAANVEVQLEMFDEMSKSADDLSNLAESMDKSLKKYKLY